MRVQLGGPRFTCHVFGQLLSWGVCNPALALRASGSCLCVACGTLWVQSLLGMVLVIVLLGMVLVHLLLSMLLVRIVLGASFGCLPFAWPMFRTILFGMRSIHLLSSNFRSACSWPPV